MNDFSKSIKEIKSMARAVLLITLTVLLSFSSWSFASSSPGGKTTAVKQTQLSLKNNSNHEVKVYLTLGKVQGCIQNVKDIPFVTNSVNSLQGWFILKKGQTVSYTSPKGTCFNGNFAFGSPPLNCPSPKYTAGINLFEFNLNDSSLGPGSQETIDISCVAGVNAFIDVKMTGGGPWNAGPNYPNLTTFKNNAIGKNGDSVGVFPYGCSNCIQNGSELACPQSPPPCAPKPPTYKSINNCNVQRTASTYSGGTVLVTFNGWAPGCK